MSTPPDPSTRFQWRTDTEEGAASRPEPSPRLRLRASQWLARYSPLLDPPETLSAKECRERLELIPELTRDGAEVEAELQADPNADERLLDAVRDARTELDGLETGLRQRLGFLSPGDPAGVVDVDRFRDRLAEAAARREVGKVAGSALPHRLELQTARPNWGTAAFMGVFAFGWLSFTTFHAFMMIGGFATAFGWFALALLGFYAIFFFAGFAMAATALRAASREEITLERRTLTVRRRFPLWTTERVYELPKGAQAYVTLSQNSQVGRRHPPRHHDYHHSTPTTTEVALLAENGTEVRLAAGQPEPEQERLVETLNEYLAATAR
ncbi:MAG: hypothetical protein ACK47B_03855 [Armatimonadota bacterium]